MVWGLPRCVWARDQGPSQQSQTLPVPSALTHTAFQHSAIGRGSTQHETQTYRLTVFYRATHIVIFCHCIVRMYTELLTTCMTPTTPLTRRGHSQTDMNTRCAYHKHTAKVTPSSTQAPWTSPSPPAPSPGHSSLRRASRTSILPWRSPWMEEPDGLKSMGLQRVGHHGVIRNKCKKPKLYGTRPRVQFLLGRAVPCPR